MVGEKNKNSYRKKRKGKLFSGRQRHERIPVGEEIDERTLLVDEPTSSSNTTTTSSSRKKMKAQDEAAKCSDVDPDQLYDFVEEEYRLINMKHFCSALSNIHVCEDGKANLIIFLFCHDISISSKLLSHIVYKSTQ